MFVKFKLCCHLKTFKFGTKIILLLGWVGLGCAPYPPMKGVLGNLGNGLCHLVITRDFKRNLEKFSRCRVSGKGDTISSCDEPSIPQWHNTAVHKPSAKYYQLLGLHGRRWRKWQKIRI